VKPRVDRERDVALGPAGPNLVEDAARHRGQPSGGFAQRGDLVLVFREPRALDDPFGRHELGRMVALAERPIEPCMTAHAEMRRLESDSAARKRPQVRGERRVVGSFDANELEIGTGMIAAARLLHRRQVAEIGQE